MNILQPSHNLHKDHFGCILVQFPSPSHIVKQVSASAQLHEHKMVSQGADVFEEGADVVMSQLRMNKALVEPATQCRPILRQVFID